MSLAGTQLGNSCFYIGPLPYSPLLYLSFISPMCISFSESQSCWEEKVPLHLSWAFSFMRPHASCLLDLASDLLEVAEAGGLALFPGEAR